MSGLSFQFEWDDPRGARGPELKATWARLRILVGDTPVTRLLDARSHSIRDAVYCPLYPLAEWLATKWWCLFQEVESPVSGRQQTYARRHSLLYAREGFALPDLEFCPTGEQVVLRWKSRDMPGSRVRFLEEGSSILNLSMVQSVLAEFIASVNARLDAEGVSGTLLQDEWDAVEQCETEERRFCEVAGAMGLDPYALDESVQAQLIDASRQLPKSLAPDFFHLADVGNLANEVRCLTDGLGSIRQLTVTIPALVELRRAHPPMDASLEPWRQGYEFARNLRDHLGMNGRVSRDLADTERAIGVEAGLLERAIVSSPGRALSFDALVGPTAQGSPGFVINKRREDSRRFAFCRSLFEYLTAPSADSPALISRVYSDRQKRNRAFAAEFLAPSCLIQERIREDSVDEEQIGDLADHFGVSPWVISHQIENHHLATVIRSY